MKKLSIITASVMFVMSIAIATVYTSCTPDPCKDIVCENDGTCIDGTCDCTAGYEGDLCETESRAKFIGGFNVTDGCSASGAANYTINVTSSSTDVTKILMSNFWNLFANNVIATVSGSSITIALQEPDNDNWTVSGSGTINGAGTMTINYTVIDPGGNSDVCTATCIKQ